MVRIAHISDSHLGSSLFQLAERKDDARKCLEKAVRMAMDHSPDVLVHTGDLFDNHFVSNDDMSFAMELFKKVQKKTTVIVIQGNHDMPYGFRYNMSPLRILENAGVIISTGSTDYKIHTQEFDGKNIEFHLVSWTHLSKITRIIRKSKPELKEAFFFAHDIPIPKEKLPKHFSYYGFGHSHNFWLDKKYKIGRSGSTCIVDWRREMGGKKKLIVIDSENGKNEYTLETLNDVREFKFLTGLDITGMGADEVNQSIRNSLDNLSPKKKAPPIIIMQINGMIDTETEEGIQRSEILQYGEKRLSPLFFHIEPNWVCLGPRDVELNEPLSIEATVRDYMMQTGMPDQDAVLATLREVVED